MEGQTDGQAYINVYFLYQYFRKKLNSGVKTVSLPDGRSGMKYTTEAHIIAKQYFEQYAKHFGDDQPDVPEIHLPSCLTRKLVFKDYSLHCITNKLKAVKRTRFLQIWRMEFPNVKVRKHQKMTQCTECAVFKEAFLKKLSENEFKKLEADNSLTKLHHHLTGVLCHGLQKSYAFTWTDQFASNCNITLNCLMTVLDDVAKNNGGSLPPTLYLQADNAAKDNKNNYVLMFFAMLVKAEIQAAFTLPDLQQLISTSVKPMPYIEHITRLWDFRKLSTSDYSLCDFKDIHHFVFSKADDKVRLKFKNWPLHSEPYRELDVTGAIPDLEVPSIVEGIPPKFSSVVTNMSGDLEKWMSTGRFMQQHLDWWKEYLETSSQRKARPNVPLPTNFQKYKNPKKQTPTLESNITDVIDKYLKKCQKKSVIRLLKKRH
ncbi:unnamed protein product [Mytilus coruscus]|uniref:DUF7869 domain-containing protein n=1 Tax=Mytilus coruscus TaxID=42192 RepID=A0A6J8AW40_MYTCO|nr:unnamed protein product [Mytilus coruscus]